MTQPPHAPSIAAALLDADAGVTKPVSGIPNNRNPAFILESPDVYDIVGRVTEALREAEPDGESPAFQPVFESSGVA